MYVKEVTVENQVGLHARPATFFIQKANEYKSSIWGEKEERRVINEALLTLSPRERLIVELRFGFAGKRELTQKEVADSLGISQSYISRLEKKIIAELKEKIAGKI